MKIWRVTSSCSVGLDASTSTITEIGFSMVSTGRVNLSVYAVYLLGKLQKFDTLFSKVS